MAYRPVSRMTAQKEKNKIDLKYNTYSQFFNTIIVITITFLIAVLIAILTKQVEVGKNVAFILVISIAITEVIFAGIGLVMLYNKMQEALRRLDKLKI